MRGGQFHDGEAGAVVDVIEKKLLRRNFFGRRVESVEIRPASGERSLPHVAVYRGPRLYVWPGSQIPIQELPARLAAGGVTAPTRPTSGALELLVPAGTTAEAAVGLAVATLRALVPASPAWSWKPVLEGP